MKNSDEKNAKLTVETIQDLLRKFQSYLDQHNNFETLDRLYVLKAFTNPLYAEVYNLHRALNIEFSDEADITQSAVNYHSQNIFDEDFLNKSYYSNISPNELDNNKRVKLGKTLFIDPVLSSDLTMSCASCHQADKGFADGLEKSISSHKSDGIHRNTPTIINAVYSTEYFYDLREYDLERQIKHVIMDSTEFNTDYIELIEKLGQSEEYTSLFEEAYPEYGISVWSISNALACYVTNTTSFNSPFDQYVRGEKEEISASIRNGYNLFMGKAACGTCHFAPTFNGLVPPYYQESESEVLAIPEVFDTTTKMYLDPDLGRAGNGRHRDQVSHFMFSFKTVSVRNVEKTAPYMHNGAFKSLQDVMAFYNNGGGAGYDIILEHQTLPDTPLNLNQNEISDLVNFMNSLTSIPDIQTENISLPQFPNETWNERGTSLNKY